MVNEVSEEMREIVAELLHRTKYEGLQWISGDPFLRCRAANGHFYEVDLHPAGKVSIHHWEPNPHHDWKNGLSQLLAREKDSAFVELFSVASRSAPGNWTERKHPVIPLPGDGGGSLGDFLAALGNRRVKENQIEGEWEW
jgi:hypothetical protein